MKHKIIISAFSIIILFGLLSANCAIAQTEGGIGTYRPFTSSASFYYLSKPGEVTMLINIWGAVRNPGRYEVPTSTNLVHLLSYAGGPTPDAELDEVRVTRSFSKDGVFTKSEIFVNLEDLAKTDESQLVLYAGDTIFLDQSRWDDIVTVITTAAIITTAITNVIIARERLR